MAALFKHNKMNLDSEFNFDVQAHFYFFVYFDLASPIALATEN